MRSTAVVLFCLTLSAAYGQDTGKLEFEVASVRQAYPPNPNGFTAGCGGGPGTKDPGLFTCSNMTLGNLVALAHRIDSFLLSGPDWLSDTHLLFDINARIAPDTTKDQFDVMFQNLLAARFRLAVHRETRELQQYELLVGKGGPKFSASPPPGSLVDSSTLTKNGCPALPVARGLAVINGLIVSHVSDWTMELLTNQVAHQLRVHVTDATGLTGKYDIAMCWQPDLTPGTNSDSGPTLQQALQDQLGLKLESKKGPVELVVVDHAEKSPVQN